MSAGILAGLLWWLPIRTLVDAILRVPAGVWSAVSLGFLAGHVLSALKWRLFLGAAGAPIGRLEAIRAHAAGLFANLCLPSLVGGDLVRAGLAIRDRGRPEAVALGSLADRVSDTAALVLLAGTAGLLSPVASDGRASGVLIGFATALPLLVVASTLAIRAIPSRRLPDRLRRPAKRLRVALDSLLARPSATAAAFGLSLAIQSAFVGMNVMLARAIGIDAPVSVWFLAWPLAKLVALVPISLGGIGVRELALASLLIPFGVSAAEAVAQSLSWEAVLIAAGLLSGAIALGLGARVTVPRRTEESS